MDEVRLAFRRLSKRPASTLASITTLACAIGAAAVTWSVLSSVLISPLPVRNPAELVVVSTMATKGRFAGTLQRGVNYPYYSYVKNSGVFEQTAAAWLPPIPLLTRIDSVAPERTQIGVVTHDFFKVLGVGIPAGRDFGAGDDQRGATPVAIVSDRYWRRAWNGSPEPVGRTLSVNGKTVTIVGIAPAGFRGINLAEAPDIYLPFHIISDIGSPNTNYLAEPNHQSSPSAMVTIVARLRQGTTPAVATARLGTQPPSTDELARTPLAASPLNVEALPVSSRAGMQRFSRLLAATVGLLLFAACVSVGLLLLLRTDARREEFAMCLALGATRARLTRGILVEGALMAVAGAILSLPIASWLFDLLASFQLPGGVALDLLELSIDKRVLFAAAVSGTLTVLAISLLAAAFGFRAGIADAIRSRAGATPRLSGRIARSGTCSPQRCISSPSIRRTSRHWAFGFCRDGISRPPIRKVLPASGS